MTPSRIEPATFQLVAQCLNQLCYHVPPELLRPSLNKPGVYKNYEYDDLDILGCNVVSLGVCQINMVPSSSGVERSHKNWLLMSSGYNEASMPAPMCELHSNIQ